MSAKILLVEDDPTLGYVIKDGLAHKGHDVILCKDGEQGILTFQQHPFDLCIFDVMMPKKDGFTLAKEIRTKNKHVPILFVTAKSMLEDKMEGFQVGGDDYITKPFSMEELALRIEVFLRRTNGQVHVDEVFTIGKYSFDSKNFMLHHPAGEKVLTQKEAEVMKLLCHNRERVLKREEILKSVWGDDDYFMGRSLDVFISKLRKYLKDDSSVEIVNYHGVGFKLEVK
ncbi:MAG: Two-component transcriptional response regulator, OmpR family [Cytophagales bacterium]|jgi:DNA-binding response OmpR family regulator|nr:response regulator transcription factor [Bacteroidota bacterium]MBS1982269.1 response regulator transcription factor [Bacteroidota bacterium]WHZ07637.1 MAG: Two-component transcriptional response regulator, OmpR family [Cytophagales bacterium]